MKRVALFGAALGAVIFLAGCSQQTGTNGLASAQASLGTYNYGGARPGIAFLVAGNLPMTGPEGVEATVTGPDGWNRGDPLKALIVHSLAGPGWWWWAYDYELVDGAYTLESQFPDGTLVKRTVTLKASDVLARPAPSLNAGTTQATVSWPAVPGAKAYRVTLWHQTNDGSKMVRWWRTADTSITFTQLNLTPGETYYAYVWAFNADLTKLIFTPPAIFKVSRARTDNFTVTSAGALKVFPKSGGQTPEGE